MNCSSLQLKTIAAILFFAANAASAARAQMVDPQTPQKHDSVLLTPASMPIAGDKIVVVTVKQPTVRHTCKVQEISLDRLVCSHHSGSTIYNAQDIEALVRPAERDWKWFVFAGFFGTGAGIITGACFLASVAIPLAIPVALIGGAIVLSSGLAFTWDDEPGPAHDTLIYQQSGTTLTVKLH